MHFLFLFSSGPGLPLYTLMDNRGTGERMYTGGGGSKCLFALIEIKEITSIFQNVPESLFFILANSSFIAVIKFSQSF